MKIVGCLVIFVLSLCHFVSLPAQTVDEVYHLALAEGGTLDFYGTLAQIDAEIILPLFEKRFAGIKVNPVDARSDQPETRITIGARRRTPNWIPISLLAENVVRRHKPSPL